MSLVPTIIFVMARFLLADFTVTVSVEVGDQISLEVSVLEDDLVLALCNLD